MTTCDALTDFQHLCQEYYTCFTLAVWGLKRNVDDLDAASPDKEKNLIVGSGHPDEGNWHGSMRIGDVIERGQYDGVYSDTIAKAFLTAIYAQWDENCRPAIAAELGVEAKSVKCDLMGDLRIVRHCIVHGKSILTNEAIRIKELTWQLSPGELRVTRRMFADLIDQINRMIVRLESS